VTLEETPGQVYSYAEVINADETWHTQSWTNSTSTNQYWEDFEGHFTGGAWEVDSLYINATYFNYTSFKQDGADWSQETAWYDGNFGVYVQFIDQSGQNTFQDCNANGCTDVNSALIQ
jgi:hypothetical protein